MTYHVDVIGYMWQGGIGSYTYNFKTLPSESDVTRQAGDFSGLYDYRIVSHETITKQYDDDLTLEIINRYKTVRDWESDDSDDMWLDMNLEVA
jgi:hypothetical protein